MAEYVEVMKQKKRMCNSTLCGKCDIFHLSGEDIGNCTQFILNNPSKAEKIVMSWAAKHPEPIYPTWYEWLKDMGLTFHDAESSWIGFTERIHHPIPADIAERLGVKPK